MSSIVQKRPEFRKIRIYTCTYCKLKLKTHFKVERCYGCNKVYIQKPIYKNFKNKSKKSGINKVF